MHGPAKVGNLQVALQSEKKVLRLDVTVDDVLCVAVLLDMRSSAESQKVRRKESDKERESGWLNCCGAGQGRGRDRQRIEDMGAARKQKGSLKLKTAEERQAQKEQSVM